MHASRGMAGVAVSAWVIGAAAARGAPDLPNMSYPSAGSTNAYADVYLRAVAPAGQPAAPTLPTVVLLHAGGYCCGHRSSLSPVAERLRQLGFDVVNASYTLSSPGVPSYPQAIRDVKNIVKWVRTVGVAQHGMLPTIVLVGSSAGATIALTAAYSLDDGVFEQGDAPPGGWEVDMVVDISGRTNMPWDFDVGNNVTNILNLMGVWMTPANRPTFEHASAIYHVESRCPPTAIYHCISDPVVPFGHGQQLAKRLRKAGVPCITHMPNTAGHAEYMLGTLDALTDSIAGDIRLLLDYAAPVVPSPPPAAAGPADLCGLAGAGGPDGEITVDDLVYFLAKFFDADLAADLASVGSVPGADGQVTVDDLVVYLGLFFAGPPR